MIVGVVVIEVKYKIHIDTRRYYRPLLLLEVMLLAKLQKENDYNYNTLTTTQT